MFTSILSLPSPSTRAIAWYELKADNWDSITLNFFKAMSQKTLFIQISADNWAVSSITLLLEASCCCTLS